MPGTLTKTSPNWLARQDPDDPNLRPSYRRSCLYYRTLYQAWPDWCATDPRFKAIYNECRRRRARGENVEVDHIVPLRSPLVCGLHVPWNLDIIHAKINLKKSNKWWPDAPFEQHSIIPWDDLRPHQLSLI